MKENQPEILYVNGVNDEEDLSVARKGVFGSNGIVSESKNDRDEPQKAPPQVEQDDPLSDHSFASIENKSQVSPPQEEEEDDDDEKEPFHVIPQKPDEEAALLSLASDGEEESSNKCHNNPITDLRAGEVPETRKEGCGGDEVTDQKPREDKEKTLEGQNAVSGDEPCNAEQNRTKPNRSILSLQDHFADDGEASFSALGFAGSSQPASVPYCGSTSLRSDSSTTGASARSFAFPVLQPEWISSPVRMKKSYNRFWKHGGWWRRLLCCRF